MYGADINTLNVYVTPGGQPTSLGNPVWSRSLNQGNKWKVAKVTITPNNNYQVL